MTKSWPSATSSFQEKCIERIRSVVREGRTVLFVSHSMDSIRSLCDSAIVLEDGRLTYEGSTEGAIAAYNLGTLGAAAP